MQIVDLSDPSGSNQFTRKPFLNVKKPETNKFDNARQILIFAEIQQIE